MIHIFVSCFLSILILAQFSFVSGEFRFCMQGYGPQRMKDTDCPGGFIFHHKIDIDKITCRQYAKIEEDNGKTLAAPTDICSDTNTERGLIHESDELEDFKSFSYFLWEPIEGQNDTQPGKFSPEHICNEECLGEYTELILDEEPIPDTFDASKVSQEDLKRAITLNKEMILHLLDEDDEEFARECVKDKDKNRTICPVIQKITTRRQSTIDKEVYSSYNFLSQILADKTQLNLIKLMAKSMQILVSAVEGYVTNIFMEQVLRGVIFISRKLETNLLDVSEDLYYRIKQVLNHCGLRYHQEFSLNGTLCTGSDHPTVEGIYNLRTTEYWQHRLTGWSYRWGRWHPLIDAAWSTIDFIQSYCYESFMKDVTLLHIYISSMEGLFPDNVQLLWRLNPSVNNDEFWNNIFLTHNLNATMRNLDAVQEAARRQSPFLRTLPRPFLNALELKEVGPPPSPPVMKKGWKRSLDAYWSRYDKLGGFPVMSQPFGVCFEDDIFVDSEHAMIENIRLSCGKH